MVTIAASATGLGVRKSLYLRPSVKTASLPRTALPSFSLWSWCCVGEIKVAMTITMRYHLGFSIKRMMVTIFTAFLKGVLSLEDTLEKDKLCREPH
ncbi:uncharacterized protein PHALS_12565 [Plasmopara halstedii]|uniref:Uncharacterized protein n=1 Tax=Plasmopara halstedii TaxID=4781 RepID=A0A0P1AM48_PLAHL|nr:uncharacterized protein PHALS_12565 [Plasmopara halstedii]CEG42277.1 hypothetical protein PHALS_12565 [Plasmopara halstedii]|eukprot:XP_024578646.1 hypothetical protein PHALS_12565 [Plasmopara halstedii]